MKPSPTPSIGLITLALFDFLLALFMMKTLVDLRGSQPALPCALAGVYTAFLVLACLGYIIGGLGLLCRQKILFMAHLVMLFVTVLNPACCCMGCIYTLPGLLVTFQDHVWQVFFPESPLVTQVDPLLTAPQPTVLADRDDIPPPE